MRITHIFLPGTFTDELSYQENMLTRVQRRLGHDVSLIVENKKLSETGTVIDTPVCDTVNEDGGRVIRLSREKRTHIGRLDLLVEAFPVYEKLCDIQPDIILVHALGHGVVNNDIIRYKKANPSCRIMTDSHEFDGVSRPYPKTVEGFLSRKYYNHINKKLFRICDKIFGITPDCIDFAIKYRCVPADRIELLPLGYDPALVDWNRRYEIRAEFRRSHGIPDDAFLIAHGGKIIPRRRTDTAIKAIRALDDPRVKLVIFGAIADEIKDEIKTLIYENRDRVVFLGQLTQKEYIKLYLASDVAFFPGGQSVLWQEAIGCGLPLLLGKAAGIEYLDRGGNIRIIESADESGFTDELKKLLGGEIVKMSETAKTTGREFFSYERVSRLITGE
ncbi:MAG: glycosyltransferase family 4 protein [Christensenella sp.]|nr:glycosyltransferase family 4 protein [Christensenella sp.]